MTLITAIIKSFKLEGVREALTENGKFFVLPVESALRIRTGELGEAAL